MPSRSYSRSGSVAVSILPASETIPPKRRSFHFFGRSSSCTSRMDRASSAGRMPTGQMSLQAMQAKQLYICSSRLGLSSS